MVSAAARLGAATCCAAAVAAPLAAQDTTTGTRLDYGMDVLGVRMLRSAGLAPRGPAMHVQLTGSLLGQGDIRVDLRPGGWQSGWFVRGRLSTLQRNRFYGWGNDTDVSTSSPYHRLDQMLGEVAVGYEHTLFPGLTLSGGPFYRWRFTDPEIDEAPGGRVDADDVPTIVADLRPYGVGGFQQFGVQGTARYERVTQSPDHPVPAGWRVVVRGAAMPAMSDQLTAMSSATVRAAASFNLPSRFNLSARAGVEKRVGGFPFMDAAFLGGRRLLRGYQKQRFAGDEALWSQVELHFPGTAIQVAGRAITLGPLAHADIGRVYLSGQSEGGWHLGRGLGLWAVDGPSGRYASVLLSWGDRSPRVYFNLGIPLLRR